MKKLLSLVLVGLVGATAACGTDGGESTVFAADAVVLDQRCAADADCPAGFECESEVEQGIETSYCVSHDEEAASAGQCPAGFELEEEHGGTFCKPHGTDGQSGGGSDDL